MLLCGKPILQVPLNLEQTLTAHATVRLGAGLSGDRNNPLDIVSKLTSMIQCEGYAKAACDFATRYEGFNGAQQLDVLASRLHRLVNQPSEPEAEIAAASVSHRVVGIASQHSARTLVVGIGTGRCGTKSLAMLLNQQPSTVITHEMRPLLPWNSSLACHDIRARFESLFNRHPQVARVGDVGHFYLPYLDQILENFSDVRVICLQRNRQDTVNSFLRWIVSTRNGRPVNHWAADRDGFDTDLWDDCFPKYPTRDMGAAIGHYWDEYYQTAGTWARHYPDKIRIFPMEPVLNDAAKIRELLAWIGVSAEQSDPVSVHIHRSHTIDIDNQWPDIQAIAKAGLGQRNKRIK